LWCIAPGGPESIPDLIEYHQAAVGAGDGVVKQGLAAVEAVGVVHEQYGSGHAG
jgi:hypothetical protein